jgi:hypothetical protein
MVALRSDARGQSIAIVAAAAAASLGVRTTVVGVGDPQGAAALWAGLGQARRDGPPRANLVVARDPFETPPCQLQVFLVVVDPQAPTFADVPPADAYVLCLAAGVATVGDLSRLLLAVDAVDADISGVLLADPRGWEEYSSSPVLGHDAARGEVVSMGAPFVPGLRTSGGAS